MPFLSWPRFILCVASVAGFCLLALRPGASGSEPGSAPAEQRPGAGLAAHAGAAQIPKKIILDTDPGVDDALALLLALNSPELEIQAITVVPGNVPLAQGVENARKIVSLADRCDIPVAAGAQRPLVQTLTTAEFWHGENGLANVELPAPRCPPSGRFAPDLIVELIHRHPGEITLVPVGPLTNIALAVSRDPSIVPLVKEVVLMGGAIAGGNVTAAAEFNIYNDPEAAKIVFSAGWPVTMIGLDVGNQALFSRAHLADWPTAGNPQSDFARALLTYLLDRTDALGLAGTPLYDPLAVGVLLDRTIVTTERLRVEIETSGELTRGQTVVNRFGLVDRSVRRGDRYVVEGMEPVEPNADVCVAVDAERFLQLFVARVSRR